MANYCSNSVYFLGEPATVKAIQELFAHIQSEQQRTNQYYLPEFVTAGKGQMVDISLYQDWISFETRWAPNLDLMVEVADHYQVGFISRFREMVNGLYGKAIYHDKELKVVDRHAWDNEDRTDDPELDAIGEEQQLLVEKYAGTSYDLDRR